MIMDNNGVNNTQVRIESVLVTGGAGFIGSHLVERLLEGGCHVTVVDNLDSYYDPAQKRNNLLAARDYDRFRFVEHDICDYEGLRRQLSGEYDAIVHLAGKAGVRPSIVAPLIYQEVNVKGTQNVLELAREWKVPQFVFASSSSVYGVNPRVPWREEDHVLMPVSPYASTKVSGELLGHVYSHLFGIRFLALRFFTVFGPRQRPDLAIHKFARFMLSGEPVTLYGNGSTRRDYTFVQDIVRGIVAALEYRDSQYEVINIGSGKTVSLLDMVNVLEDLLGMKAQRLYLPLHPGDVPHTWADISRAKRLLGYRPSVSFRDGVQAFLEWMERELV